MLTRLFIGKDINQAKNTFVWTALSGIVYSLQSLIFLIILTNLMGKSAAGLYSLGIMIANQMLTVGKYSVRNYQVSDINENIHLTSIIRSEYVPVPRQCLLP